MTNRTLTGLLVLTFAPLLALPSSAQTRDAEHGELASYTLTMATVRKVANAMKALNELEAKDPKMIELARLRKEIEALEGKDDLSEAEAGRIEKLRDRADRLDEELEQERPVSAGTLDGMELQIKKHPHAPAILAKEGITPREFARTVMCLFQAAMVVGFSQGQVDMTRLPPGVNPANVKFFQENRKELEALQRQMEGVSRR